MKRRTLLKNQLIDAWKTCIENDYCCGVVNGERALQACLYHRLAEIFTALEISNQRHIFIEPTIYAQGRTWRRMPDMVICDSRNVIAIIELKFHPRTTLSGREGRMLRQGAEKDLGTLLGIAGDLNATASVQDSPDSERIIVSNERYLGKGGASRTYGLAPNLMLVWAGIYKYSDGCEAAKTERLARVFEDADITIHGGLLELHARTKQGQDPICENRYSGWRGPQVQKIDDLAGGRQGDKAL